MAEQDARDELVEFLERKAFDPVLDASADDYDENWKKEWLRDVQEATRAEVERFREQGSVAGVIDEYKGDLNSEPAKKVHRRLHELDLPTLNDIEDEFEGKVRDLGFEY